MDPTACLQLILESIEDYHTGKAYKGAADYEDLREDTIEHLENLLYWLKKNGFMPSIPDKYKPQEGGRADQAV